MDAEKIQAAIVFHALFIDAATAHDGPLSNVEEIQLAEKAVRIVNAMNIDIENPTQ